MRIGSYGLQSSDAGSADEEAWGTLPGHGSSSGLSQAACEPLRDRTARPDATAKDALARSRDNTGCWMANCPMKHDLCVFDLVFECPSPDRM